MSWRGKSPILLRQTLDGIEALLQDAPLDAPGIPELVAMYTLPADGPALLRDARAGAPREEPAPKPDAPAPGPGPVLAPLDPAALHQAEQGLAGADVARFARRRAVCRLGRSGMQHAWDDRFLSVPELIDAVAPGRSAHTGTWLLRRLTRLLDRRMLALLCHPDELRGAGPFSLTLNVSTLLSPDFLRFDAALTPGLRGRVVVDLLPVDVLADPSAFVFARNFARARSYRVGLGAVGASCSRSSTCHPSNSTSSACGGPPASPNSGAPCPTRAVPVGYWPMRTRKLPSIGGVKLGSASFRAEPQVPKANDAGGGGAERDRTADLLIANEALSQLSYSPVPCRAGTMRMRLRPVDPGGADCPAVARPQPPLCVRPPKETGW